METYTFSTALRMMRYGGKKMKPISWSKGSYVFVKNNNLMQVLTWYKLVKNNNLMQVSTWYEENRCDLYAEDIMGSWIEVKE